MAIANIPTPNVNFACCLIAYLATGTVIFLVLGLTKLMPVKTVADIAVVAITG
ncbi:MAG: hypothetical protein ACRCYC_02815 [Paraclostridium sp.]